MLPRQLCVVFVFAASCEGPSEPLKSTARLVQPVATATKFTGESCAKEGVSVCRPGPRGEPASCFHYGPGLDEKGEDPWFVCTTTCATDRDCPLEFTCVDLLPGRGNRVCAPRPDFQPKRALPRPPAPLDPPTPPAPSIPLRSVPLSGDGGTP